MWWVRKRRSVLRILRMLVWTSKCVWHPQYLKWRVRLSKASNSFGIFGQYFLSPCGSRITVYLHRFQRLQTPNKLKAIRKFWALIFTIFHSLQSLHTASTTTQNDTSSIKEPAKMVFPHLTQPKTGHRMCSDVSSWQALILLSQALCNPWSWTSPSEAPRKVETAHQFPPGPHREFQADWKEIGWISKRWPGNCCKSSPYPFYRALPVALDL